MARETAPYQLSRAALRSRFGARKIDATAPQSAADTTPSGEIARETGMRDLTPSGRMRSFRERGLMEDEAQILDDRFTERQFASTRPIDMLRRRSAPQSPLDAMSEFDQGELPIGFLYEQGGATAKRFLPTTGGTNLFASLDGKMGNIAGSPVSTLFPSLRARNNRSILDDAEVWRQSL